MRLARRHLLTEAYFEVSSCIIVITLMFSLLRLCGRTGRDFYRPKSFENDSVLPLKKNTTKSTKPGPARGE